MKNKGIAKDKYLKYDMLTEMFNIGVGKAASLLSDIINRKILLDVSQIDIFSCEGQKEDLGAFLSKVSDGALMVSSIQFKEKIAGEANLIFPTDKMRTFINLCVSQEIGNGGNDTNFTDIDFDVIKEIGNIVLNSIMGELGNFLDIPFTYSMPMVKVFDKANFEKGIDDREWSCIIMLYVTFIIDGTEIKGAIIIDLTLDSLYELMRIIEKMEEDIYV